jgi:GT2 family glycosyltransferase
MAVGPVAAAPDVSIVIVNYRTRDLAERCLRSIAESTEGTTYEVVIVDNGGDDGGLDAAPWSLPSGIAEVTRVLALGENVGFARAVNRGVAASTGRYALLLNPDTVVLDGAIQRLVRFADRRPGHGIYGGRTVDADGRLDPRSCWAFPTLWSTFCFAVGLTSVAKGHRILDPEAMGGWERDTVRLVDVVTGCLCLVDRSAWDRLGGLDERFFVYGEDVDLALRAHATGYRPLLCPDATVVHDVGRASATRADKLVLLHRGKVSLFRKHWHPVAAVLGVHLLRLGVALRARTARDGWTELHRRRREWIGGHEGSEAGR